MPLSHVVIVALVMWTARLAESLEKGGLEDVIWTAKQAGPEELAAALAADPIAARAATLGAPAVDDAWSLLDELAVRAGGWERAAAVDAARAAARIAARLDGNTAIERDLPDDLLADLGARWLAIAKRPDRWSDVRVTALEVAARLARARRATADDDPGLGYDLGAMLTDPDPALRRAAAELVRQPAPAIHRAALVRTIIDDTDPAVVATAAQALCADLGSGDPARPILAALGPQGLRRLRAVLAAPTAGALPAGAIVDAARCLAADGTAPSRAVIGALAVRAPRGAKSGLGKIRIRTR